MTVKQKLTSALLDMPIIAAAKNEDGLQLALESDCAAIFLLFGTICSVGTLVQQIKDGGKMAFVHLDLIEGLSNRDVAVDFIQSNTQADGIISTRLSLIRRGRELGLFTIQRFFIHDSLSFEMVIRQSTDADMVDILPGSIPKTIHRLSTMVNRPLIASGLLADKEDIISALSAGALAVSTTSPALWDI